MNNWFLTGLFGLFALISFGQTTGYKLVKDNKKNKVETTARPLSEVGTSTKGRDSRSDVPKRSIATRSINPPKKEKNEE